MLDSILADIAADPTNRNGTSILRVACRVFLDACSFAYLLPSPSCFRPQQSSQKTTPVLGLPLLRCPSLKPPSPRSNHRRPPDPTLARRRREGKTGDLLMVKRRVGDDELASISSVLSRSSFPFRFVFDTRRLASSSPFLRPMISVHSRSHPPSHTRCYTSMHPSLFFILLSEGWGEQTGEGVESSCRFLRRFTRFQMSVLRPRFIITRACETRVTLKG